MIAPGSACDNTDSAGGAGQPGCTAGPAGQLPIGAGQFGTGRVGLLWQRLSPGALPDDPTRTQPIVEHGLVGVVRDGSSRGRSTPRLRFPLHEGLHVDHALPSRVRSLARPGERHGT